MKTIKLLLLFVAGSLAVHAATLPCVLATLHSYDASGFTCSEGNDVFSNFSFLDSGTDMPLPADTSVEVTPILNGLEFDAGFFVPSGLTLDASIAYTVTIAPGTLIGDSLSIGGFGQTGTGALDVAESVCVGAAFNGAGICPTTVDSLNVFDNNMGLKQSDSVSFSATTVGIIKDIALTGGTGASSANLSLVDNVTPFAAPPVPEPATLVLAGLTLFGFSRRRRKP